MGRGLRDRGVWWGILRGRYRCLFVCLVDWLVEFAARAKKKKNNSREDDVFLTHTHI